MWSAVLWGGIAGSATLLGALAVLFFSIPKQLIAYIMALGTGALIGATLYELLEDSLQISNIVVISIGFFSGAVIFTLFDYLVTKKGGEKRKHSSRGMKQAGGAGLAIFFGTIMDALPESAMIGLSLMERHSVSLSLVIAIFISNFPEGLSSTEGLQKSGFARKHILMMWTSVLLVSALSSLAGASLLVHATNDIKAGMSAFAGGGIIAMVASTMMPEAYKEGGPVVGFFTAIGVFISLTLNHLG
ncbi:ZIP family metal transporter [Aureibacillus halotolerans]|uniref:ZIP family zinc transporter n=1 Tax=Aureibacillus halotolerans TaxID=1508390 RepID=A0A4R6U7W1_9BACI|nr:ZIP family metal transporter [Aureibacillus halotolerans]TDQ42630.1 ZIP family zinc transporter [Aureibacillus halotolerans]